MRSSALLRVAAIAIVALAARNAAAADSALIEAAKKEGQVVWYTTLIVNQIVRPLKAAFEKKYPGVTLQFTRADDIVTAEKIIAEGRAGRVQADIFDGIANMLPLQEAGLLSPFTVPNEADYPAELKAKDGYWIAAIMYVFTPGINTTLLPKKRGAENLSGPARPETKGQDGLERQLHGRRLRVRRQRTYDYGRAKRHGVSARACCAARR